jgi:hypothetical protein
LPITPKFKANLIGRYTFNLDGMDAYFQTAIVHVGERTSDLRTLESQLLGNLPAYTTVDFTTGIHKNSWSVDFYLEERVRHAREQVVALHRMHRDGMRCPGSRSAISERSGVHHSRCAADHRRALHAGLRLISAS